MAETHAHILGGLSHADPEDVAGIDLDWFLRRSQQNHRQALGIRSKRNSPRTAVPAASAAKVRSQVFQRDHCQSFSRSGRLDTKFSDDEITDMVTAGTVIRQTCVRKSIEPNSGNFAGYRRLRLDRIDVAVRILTGDQY